MERLIGYGRVSTADQATSVDVQTARLREYAERQGTQLAKLFIDEDVSGALPLKHRPQGRRMWDDLQPGDRVVFCKVDRCFRSMADAATTLAFWRNIGVGVTIVDLGIDVATPAGELFFNQLASFAAFERQMIGTRIREAIAQRKSAGRPYGHARPLGWVRSGPGKAATWAVCAEERRLGQRVVQMRDAGMTLNEVARTLAREGIVKPGKARAARAGKYRGCYYLAADVARLYRATKAKFPVLPRDAIKTPVEEQLSPA